jgi:hypothetical protein
MSGRSLLHFLPFSRKQRERAEEQSSRGAVTVTATSRLLISTSLAISCIAHLAFLTPAVILGGGNLFDPAPADAITVDIVSPDDLEEARNARALRAAAAPSSDAKATSASAPASEPPPQAQSPSRAIPQSDTQEAAAQPQPAEPARPPAAWLPPQFALAPPESEPHDPAAADMFAMPLTLPGGRIGYGYQGPATEKANIDADAIAAFRSYLKTCAIPPAEVTAKARVTLRILLNPDGTLVNGPDQNPRPVGNIYGMPNGGGGELLNAAIAAVRKCQPYNMLPPDKYDEWKTFDITFTRENF